MAPVPSCTTPYNVAVITCARAGHDDPKSTAANKRAMAETCRERVIRTSSCMSTLNDDGSNRSRDVRVTSSVNLLGLGDDDFRRRHAVGNHHFADGGLGLGRR